MNHEAFTQTNFTRAAGFENRLEAVTYFLERIILAIEDMSGTETRLGKLAKEILADGDYDEMACFVSKVSGSENKRIREEVAY